MLAYGKNTPVTTQAPETGGGVDFSQYYIDVSPLAPDPTTALVVDEGNPGVGGIAEGAIGGTKAVIDGFVAPALATRRSPLFSAPPLPAYFPVFSTPILRTRLEVGPDPLSVRSEINMACTAEEKTNLILHDIAVFNEPATWFNRDDAVIKYWRSTIHGFVEAFPLSVHPVEEALTKATLVTPIDVFDTASGRGRLIRMNLEGLGEFKVLVVFGADGELETVAMSEINVFGNIEQFGENFFEVPKEFRESLIARLGSNAVPNAPVRSNARVEVQAPIGRATSVDALIQCFADNPALNRLKTISPEGVGILPRLAIFNVRESTSLGFYVHGTILSKIDLSFDEETVAHEIVHVLWDSTFFNPQKKSRWLNYVRQKYPEIFALVKDTYAKSVLTRALSESRAADETLAYMFQVLADKNHWRAFEGAISHPIIIDAEDLQEFVALGLLDEGDVSYWTEELSRRRQASRT